MRRQRTLFLLAESVPHDFAFLFFYSPLLIKSPQKVFRLENINSTRKLGNPYGLSGSGLWTIKTPIPSAELNDKVKLTGILTTWYKEEALILTTDLSEVIKLIESNI